MTLLALPEQFTIDGTSLYDLALVAVPVSGLDEIPSVRGDDAPYTGLDGAQYLRKLRDPTTFVFHIYVLGTDANGIVLTTNRRHARANLDTLVLLLAKAGQRSVVRLMPDGSPRGCLAEVIRVERAPDPLGDGSLFSLVATFRNAEGKWYGTESTDPNRPIGATAIQFNAVVGGTIPTHRARYTFTGPFVNPRVTNQSTGAYFEAAVTVTTGNQLVVDAYTFGAMNAGVDVRGSITFRNPLNAAFMALQPGSNSMTVSSSSAGGTLTTVIVPAFY